LTIASSRALSPSSASSEPLAEIAAALTASLVGANRVPLKPSSRLVRPEGLASGRRVRLWG
jgi:hypothetical protein